MKRNLSYSLIAVLFVLGIVVGVLSAKTFQGTYAQGDQSNGMGIEDPKADENGKQEESAKDPKPQDGQAGAGDETVGEDMGKDEPAEDEGLPKDSDGVNDNGEKDINVPERPLGEIKSWWFKRNKENLPPTVDKANQQLLAGKGYYLGDTSQKRIYLTFDEGYENGNTAEILDILGNNGVKAAFFVTGKYIDEEPELVKRMVAEGHIVGNHTENHPSMPTVSNEVIKEELQVVEGKFRKLTGQEMSYLRPPKGEYNARTLEASKILGYDTIFWSMAYKDWDTQNQPGKEVAYNHVLDNIHNGAIILLHAVSDSNTEALDDIIKDVKAKGYVFGSLDQLK